MQCVILAGGLGTRLRPVTETIPKALVPVSGTPFVRHQLRLLAAQGVDSVLLLTGYRGDQIADEVGDGSGFGLRIAYSGDGPTLLGTGGAVRRALDRGLLDDTFLVLYGDSYLPVEYRPVFDAVTTGRYAAVMTVLHHQDRLEPSNVSFDGARVTRYDKTASSGTPGLDHVDYGLIAMRRDTIAAHVPADTVLDLGVVYAELAGRGELGGHLVTQRFYEVGSPAGIAALERHLDSGLR